jgi:hypothetical protein
MATLASEKEKIMRRFTKAITARSTRLRDHCAMVSGQLADQPRSDAMTRLITLSFLAVTIAAGVTVVGAGDSAAQTQVRDHRGPAHGPRTNPASMPGGVDVRSILFKM